ncbi:calmodulin-binding-domain-containing protein [Chytridium lagenaria]|nr:calmodulin-binding-domain-containing protein [Chytridium lagenaria]
MYRSKFASQARTEYVAGKRETASMGPAKVEVKRTDGFLKKGEREMMKVVGETFVPDRTVRKAPVPKEPGKAPPPTSKDFIKLNALDNINSSAKSLKTPPQTTVTKRTTAQPQPTSLNVKKQAEKIKEDQVRQLKEDTSLTPTKDGMVPLPEDERIRILEGLKANWEKLNSDYQKLSLTVDTVPKIARKVNMEQQLKHLEDHIAKFSHPHILVNFNSAFR